MTLQLPVRKQTLRLALGILALIITVVLTVASLVIPANNLLLASVTTHLHTELRLVAIILLLFYSLIFILYAVSYSKGRSALLVSAVLLLAVVILPVDDLYVNAWTGFIQQLLFVLFLAVLGWHIRHTFNLPLGFPALTKIGTIIWILDLALLIWLVVFPSIWPPLGFLLETAILWLFTAGIFIRHQINKKLGG